MKFRFDPNLDYQLNAIQAVARLFEGAPRQAVGFGLVAANGEKTFELCRWRR